MRRFSEDSVKAFSMIAVNMAVNDIVIIKVNGNRKITVAKPSMSKIV